MQLQVLPLEWRKAKRYEIKQVRRAKAGEPEGAGSNGMLGDDYEMFPRREQSSELAPSIVPCTKEEPFDVAVSAECKISLALANTVRPALVTAGPLTAVPLQPWFAPACAFAEEWGLPFRRTGSVWLSDFLPAAEEVRLALKCLERGADLHVGKAFEAAIAGDRSLQVKNLLGLCWAEIIEAAERKDQFYSCQQCDKIGVQPGWGRPRNYCSDACRQAAARDRARKGTGL
jgi:hypothetical protein